MRRTTLRRATASCPAVSARKPIMPPYDQPWKEPVKTYRSTAHPKGRSPAAVFGLAVVSPLASCMLPIMIVTLVALLEGVFFLPYFLLASMAALGVASLWTHFALRSTPAAIQVKEDRAAVSSIWEVLQSSPHLNWHPVYDLREHSEGLIVTIGHDYYSLRKANWPRLSSLADALEQARDAAYPHSPLPYDS